MTNMVKGYNQLISVRISTSIVTMTIVEKQNDSGFKFNERLLILVHGQFLGYISKVKMNDHAQNINIIDAKVKIPIKHLFNSEVDDNILKLKFTSLQDGKLIPKEWVLKFTTNKLSQLWKQLIQYQIKQCKMPKSSRKSKQQSRKSKLTQQQKVQKQKKTRKQQEIHKPEVIETPIKPVPETPKKNTVIIEGAKVQASGTFDNDLFGDESDEDISGKVRKTNKSNQDISNNIPQKTISQQKVQQSSPINYPSPSKNYVPEQSHSNHAELTNEKKQIQQIQKSRRTSRIQLNLPQIEQQQTEQHHDQKSSKNVRAKMENLKRSSSINAVNKTSSINAVNKTDSLISEVKKKADDDLQIYTINQLTQRMKQKNQKFPINQITHDDKQIEDFFKLYSKNVQNIKNSKQMERMVDAILDQMRSTKQYKSVMADSDNKQADWIYRQLTQQQTYIISQFNNYCSKLMKQIVLELHNKNFNKIKLVKQNDDFIQLICHDVEIKIPLITFSDHQNEMNILNLTNLKTIQNQHKAYKYLYSVFQNRGFIRVPLTCICQYGGFTGFFKAKAIYYEKNYDDRDQELRNEIGKIQKIKCLPLKHLIDSGCIKPLNEFQYSQMRKGQTSSNFKFYFVDRVEEVFPYDITDSIIQKNKILREQLVDQQVNDYVIPHKTFEDISDTNKRVQQRLVNLANKINSKIEKISNSISNLQFLFISPKQLSIFIHKEGVNLKYLGKIYQKTYDHFAKSLLLAEIIARISKKFMNKALQDSCLEQNHSFSTFQQMESIINSRTIDFLNCLLGNNNQSDELWRFIHKNAQKYYRVQIQGRENLCKGQLLVSLIQHCQLNLNWRFIEAKSIFKEINPLKIENILKNKIKIKSYRPNKNKSITKLIQLLSQQTHQNFKTIVEELELKKQVISDYLTLFDIDDQLRVYLANFIDPDQLDWTNNFSHLSIFGNVQPTLSNYKIELKAIKYYLQKGNKFKYLNKFSDFSNKIQAIYGSNHPILSDLYQLFAQYHKSKGQIQDALSFLKSSVFNISALSGDNNQIITNKFYSIYKLLTNVGRQKEAYQYLNKAMKILQNAPARKVSLYGQIKLQISRKLLNEGNFNSALTQLLYTNEVFQSYEKDEQNFQQEKICVIQMLYTCFKKLNKREEIKNLSQYLESKLVTLKNHQNFQQTLWIIVQVNLQRLQKQSKYTFFKLINNFPIKHSLRFYKKSLQMMKKRVSKQPLSIQIQYYGKEATNLLETIDSSNILKKWQNFNQKYERLSYQDLISMIEELIYIFGKDRLNSIYPRIL